MLRHHWHRAAQQPLSQSISRCIRIIRSRSIGCNRSGQPSGRFSQAIDRGLILLEGRDANKFLKNLTTNNTDLLENGGAALFSMFLSHQGRVITDAFIYPKNVPEEISFNNQSFIVDCNKQLLEPLLKHFSNYKLRTKVEIKNVTDDYSVWGVWQEEKDPSLVWTQLSHIGCEDPRSNAMGMRVLVQKPRKPLIPPNFEELPPSEYLIHRILNGVGEAPHDIKVLESFPLESNLDYMNGVSFEKGCYLGQELTARTFHRGVTRKRIVPVELCPSHEEFSDQPILKVNRKASFPLPPPGTPITLEGNPESGEKQFGYLGTSIHNIGLALLRLAPFKDKVFKVGDLKLRPFIPSWWPSAPQP